MHGWKIAAITLMSLASSTIMASPWYADAQFGQSMINSSRDTMKISGYVDNHTGATLPFKESSLEIDQQTDNNFATRFAFGKFLFPFLAVEAGGSYFHSMNESDTGIIHVSGLPAGQPDDITISSNDSKAQFYAFDLSTKLGIPWHRLFIYGTGGVAMVHSQYDPITIHLVSHTSAVDPNSDIVIEQETGRYGSEGNTFRPRWGGGVAWRLSKHLEADASYTQIVGNHKSVWSNQYVPDLNMVSGNVSFLF